jgi:hypothetical protein
LTTVAAAADRQLEEEQVAEADRQLEEEQVAEGATTTPACS